jgi:hypothetical protein
MLTLACHCYLCRRIVFFPRLRRGSLRIFGDPPKKIRMADTGVIDLDGDFVVEKHGCGRPHGNKNKPKVAIMEASSSTPAKRCPGRPLGSRNKAKASTL